MLHAERPVIYQLMVRHFGNTNATNKPHGTLAENGCGKFVDINDTALKSLKDLGITHVWLTGVIQQATRTDYSAIGQPADDADICKGQAGSPYAIKDYFDVCPDYAIEPAKRLNEFRELVKLCHAHGLKVILDFVPNHVSRAYRSDIRPELSFGEGDDRGQFFNTDNHFYYLRLGAPPLKLPTNGQNGCDGRFDLEHDFGRVTGNNAATWTPSHNDWFETVKLNYGINFIHEHSGDHATENRTWRCMDAILAYWQHFGVDGFRCDMAHMIPMPFWRYA
jgi:glycosidase